ncbi:MAG TPA: hypothetical protein VKF37_01770 [Chloroflexota bacterium]|nr:hypothetical protein [Chloroflexota bacterium]
MPIRSLLNALGEDSTGKHTEAAREQADLSTKSLGFDAHLLEDF